MSRVEVNCSADKFVRAIVLSLAAEETEEQTDGDEGAGDVESSFGVAATRVRRSTSLVIIAGGMLTGIAGLSGRPLALVGAW